MNLLRQLLPKTASTIRVTNDQFRLLFEGMYVAIKGDEVHFSKSPKEEWFNPREWDLFEVFIDLPNKNWSVRQYVGHANQWRTLG